MPVMLARNLWTYEGLVNGSRGVVRGLAYADKSWVALVEFPDYTGPAFLQDHPTYVPIGGYTNEFRGWNHGNKKTEKVWQKQLPLMMAWGWNYPQGTRPHSGTTTSSAKASS